MKATKSIFEKAYLIKAQAEKAAVKELGADWAESHFILEMDKKFSVRVKELATIHPELAAAEAAMPADVLAEAVDLGQAHADKLANASMGVMDAKPRISSCEKPTKKVWHIADAMPKASRKDVMAECVRQGIAYGTARTQYQAWFKASQECMRGDIRLPHQKGE